MFSVMSSSKLKISKEIKPTPIVSCLPIMGDMTLVGESMEETMGRFKLVEMGTMEAKIAESRLLQAVGFPEVTPCPEFVMEC